jgi:hypothetical protein
MAPSIAATAYLEAAYTAPAGLHFASLLQIVAPTKNAPSGAFFVVNCSFYLFFSLPRGMTEVVIVARTGGSPPAKGLGGAVSFLGFFASLLVFC